MKIMKDFITKKELYCYVETFIVPELEVMNYPEVVYNRYYKNVKFKLEPVAVALYDFINGAEIALCEKLITNKSDIVDTLERIDICKLYFNYKWHKEYMGLLD